LPSAARPESTKVVVSKFGGLLAGVLSVFWCSKLDILPRFLQAALSASVTAMLFGLVVYFSHSGLPVEKNTLLTEHPGQIEKIEDEGTIVVAVVDASSGASAAAIMFDFVPFKIFEVGASIRT
jgi:hypothetical protein